MDGWGNKPQQLIDEIVFPTQVWQVKDEGSHFPETECFVFPQPSPQLQQP